MRPLTESTCSLESSSPPTFIVGRASTGVAPPGVDLILKHAGIFATGLLSPSLPIGMAHMEILVHDSRNDKCSIKSSSSTADTSPDANLTYLYR